MFRKQHPEYVRLLGEAAGAARGAADRRETRHRGNAMTVRIAGLSLALMLFVSMMAAPRPRAQSGAPDPVFFQSQVFPVFEAAKCSGCHAASGVASATRLHFPEKDATPAQIQAFGLSLVESRRSRRCVEVAAADQADERRAPHRRRPHQAGIARRADRREVGGVAGVGVRCDAGCGDEIAGRRAKARPRRSSSFAASRTRSTTTPCAICSATTASRRSDSRRRITSTASRIS